MCVSQKHISHHPDLANSIFNVPLFSWRKSILLNLGYYMVFSLANYAEQLPFI